MSGAGETPPQHRRTYPRRRYPHVDQLVDDYEEVTAMTPIELKRYSGEW